MIIIFFILLFAAVFVISLLVYAIKSFVIAFLDAWTNYNPDAVNNDIREIDQTIIDELEHLHAQKRGYAALYFDLEKQLEYASDKQKIVIKRQLLTLDNKTFLLDKKINKLLEKLE